MSDPFPPLLDVLTRLPGIAGHETQVQEYLLAQLAPLADEAWSDPIGNVIARFGDRDAQPGVAILAHMDTLGFLVKRIHEDGTLGVVAVGSVNTLALPGAAVQVGSFPGIIGVRAQHLAQAGDTLPDIDDLYIQIDPAAIPQIEITTPVIYAPQTIHLGDRWYASPYLDNRAGCAVLLEVARWLQQAALPYTVYVIATVQEETTCAGAMCALQAVKPSQAIFIDGTLTYDTPETRRWGAVRLGGGPVLTAYLYISGLNGWHADPRLRAYFKQQAAQAGIPFQQDAIHGLMSDARVSTWLGIPSTLIGLPVRGKHGPLEIMHLDDLSHAVRLLASALPGMAAGFI